jgi:TolB-like protein/Tfp pilus assembly protein PilF
VTEPSHAVFLSYASQDAKAAERICKALRGADIEVWFDQSELRGGDVWDRQIRERIHDCRLFIALISAHTEARDEGYFRHEWQLAVERTHHMSDRKPFLVPVVIDDTRERGASVPDKLHDVQWARLPGGETPPEFIARIKRLLSSDVPAAARLPAAAAAGSAAIPVVTVPASRLRRVLPASVAVLVLVALVYFLADKLWSAKQATPAPPGNPNAASASPSGTPSARSATTAFNPPPHSVAVLPFVNMSRDKDQEYFSDGLTEEILNSLARISELQVSARTSAFSFKGKDLEIGTIARALNVGAILEGSVRRAGHTIRVTAQLNNGVTGFHLWSETYDRDLTDVLKLQTEIANAVAGALKVKLLGDSAAKLELGGTRNPAAFDAYLRALSTYQSASDESAWPKAIAGFTEAIRLDPNFALAFARRSLAVNEYSASTEAGAALRHDLEKAAADARQAITLAPDLAEAHLALSDVFASEQNFAPATEELDRALALAPGNAEILGASATFASYMGRFDASLAAARRVVLLDPLSPISQGVLAGVLLNARRYEEAVAALTKLISLNPGNKGLNVGRGYAYYELGDLDNARSSCEATPDYWQSQWCLALVYNKLGRHADAEAEVAKIKAAFGDASAFQYATIYAAWGDHQKALEWLDTAMRVRDTGLIFLKTSRLLDPLRQEPRFQAIERELNFPE